MLHFFSVTILFVFCSLMTSAQTKIWGAGATIGNLEGTFQNNFITTGVLGNYAPNNWTALSVYENSVTFPGNAYWKKSLLGYSQGAYALNSLPINSPSQSNGVAIFDSDYMDNNGILGATGTGTAPASHKGILISPNINLNGYTDSSLVIRFFSQHRITNTSKLSISMSVDSGVTWSSEIDYTSQHLPNTGNWTTVYFSSITAGINNLNNCRIRFTFEGEAYYVIIDDFSIEVAPAYDIAIATADINSPILEEQGNYIKIGNSRYISHKQIQTCYGNPACSNQFIWGARAINYGTKNILPSDSARVRVEIDLKDQITGTFIPSVYTDTIYITTDTLKFAGINSFTPIKELKDLGFLVNYLNSDFHVKYWVEHKHLDGFKNNDTIHYTITVNESSIAGNHLYYESKAQLDSGDNRVLATAAVFPLDSFLTYFEYGSVFYNAYSSAFTPYILSIESIDFRYYLPDNYTGDSTQTLFMSIYEFTDDGNGYLDKSTELTQVGITRIDLTGLGTTQPMGSYGLASGHNFVDPIAGLPMPSLDVGFYVVSILQSPSLLGKPLLFDSSSGIWIGVDSYNHALNSISTTPNNIIPQSSFLRTMDSTGNDVYNWQGLGGYFTPSIGIYTSTPIINSIQNSNTSLTSLTLSPNPASDYLNINYEHPTMQEELTFSIVDLQGRVLQTYPMACTSDRRYTLPVYPLVAGVYVLEIKKEGKVIDSQIFVKQ